MAKRDYYDLLGVGKDADEAALKAAFRKLAMVHHPDKNPGDKAAEAKFKEINEAYEVLRDPQKRGAYDRFGHAAFEQGGMGGGGMGGAQAGGFGSFADIFNDIFDDLTGRRGQQRGSGGRERGADLRYNMEIALEDAFKGKTATVKIPTSITCEVCSGSGAKPGSKPKQCSTCAGHGRVRATQGFFSIERPCPTCGGRGEVIENPCSNCGGAGRTTRERSLSVNIPAGVEDGTRIRLANEGEAGLRGGPPGDLYIFLSIEPHPFFQREGADLHCRVPVAMATAALGGEITVPTIDGGKGKVQVSEGTQTGKQFRLKGKGMPVLRSRDVGDMYVQVMVETPKNLTRRQRELLAEFDKESTGHTHPESEGFFAKAKSFWDNLGQ